MRSRLAPDDQISGPGFGLAAQPLSVKADVIRLGPWLRWAYETLPERDYLRTLKAVRCDQERAARKRRKAAA